jgi:hypothetical protein
VRERERGEGWGAKEENDTHSPSHDGSPRLQSNRLAETSRCTRGAEWEWSSSTSHIGCEGRNIMDLRPEWQASCAPLAVDRAVDQQMSVAPNARAGVRTSSSPIPSRSGQAGTGADAEADADGCGGGGWEDLRGWQKVGARARGAKPAFRWRESGARAPTATPQRFEP